MSFAFQLFSFPTSSSKHSLPLIPLQAKLGGAPSRGGSSSKDKRTVSINSASGEAGGGIYGKVEPLNQKKVSINSASGEAGGNELRIILCQRGSLWFPLIPLQAKLGGATFLNHDTARVPIPQIYAPLWRNNQHGNFCQNDDPQTLVQYIINAGQRNNQGLSDSWRCVCGVPCKHEKRPLIHL